MLSLGFDTETDLITEERPTPDLVCGSFAGAFPPSVLDVRESVELVSELIERPEVEFVGLNIAFDFRVMIAAGLDIAKVFDLYDAGRVLDVGIAWHLDDIANGRFTKRAYSLQAAASVWLGEHLEKEDTYRLRYGELKHLRIDQWPVEAVEYAKNDSITPLKLKDVIPESKDARRQAAWDFWLSLSGAHGFPTDQHRVAALRQRVIDEAAELIQKLPPDWLSIDRKGVLHKHTGTIQKYVATKFPKHPRTGKTKKPSLAYEDLIDTEDPALTTFAALGQRLSILDNDLCFLTRPRVRTRYGLADTGRTTSSGSDEFDCYTNLQNLKKEGGIRECLVPEEGHVLLIADYDGLELATIAQVCVSLLGRSKLAEMLRDPTAPDPHTYMAAHMLNITPQEAMKRKKDKSDKEFDHARQCGKIANFGMAGGAGPDAVRDFARSTYGVRISRDDAVRLKDVWFRAFPEMREYLALGGASSPTVQQLFVGRLRGNCGYTVINNTRFQGLGGDITKAAGFAISRECYAVPSSALYGARIPAFVHDEFVVSCSEANMIAGAARLRELMTTGAPKRLCPDVPLKTEPVIARRWSKMAKNVIVDGMHVPWDCAA